MNLFSLPWLEIAIVVAMIGSPIVSRFRDPNLAFRWGLFFTATAFGCVLLACWSYYTGTPARTVAHWTDQQWLFGRQLIALDDLSAALVPAAALLHLLSVLSTARAHMRRYSFAWSLAAMSIRLATFSCHDPWTLIGLLTISTIPPYVELRNRRRPTRIYMIHMAIFVGFMIVGWALVEAIRPASGRVAEWATIPLAIAVLVRCGAIPAHCWVTDWLEHASMGIALLFVIPLSGVYAATRLLLPVASERVLLVIALVSLLTALYSAGMAATQRETRRFFAFLLLSHLSLVMVGVMLHSQLSLTGSLCLWFSVIVSLGGFGLTIRALESRFARLSLVKYHGLYEHTPELAVFFLVTGLASVGFPLTLGFISTELLVEGAVEASALIGAAVAAVTMLNGIAVLRAYFLLFTGTRHVSSVSLKIGSRERIAVLTMSALILGGGLFPQPGVVALSVAAEQLLHQRYVTLQGRPVKGALVHARSQPPG
jgi:NADH-quinone oxidoreductase subunit M